MYYLIAFYQRVVQLWCHAQSFTNAPRKSESSFFSYGFKEEWIVGSKTDSTDVITLVLVSYVVFLISQI